MLKSMLVALLLIAITVSTISCGTILHPERKGQPAGKLDLKIVALDAVGLLLFFVPGVIAFAVDFNNGTIYLPPNAGYSAERPGEFPEELTVRGQSADQTETWITLDLPPEELTAKRVAAFIEKQTGQSVTLDENLFRQERLKQQRSAK